MAENNKRPIGLQRNLRPPPPPKSKVSTPAGKQHDHRILLFKTNALAFQAVKKVRISHFEKGPLMFCVQLLDNDEDFGQLVAKLQKIELRPIDFRPSIGMACLARHKGKIFRAAIAKIPQQAHQDAFFNCVFVDYGFSADVAALNIFYIPDVFMTLNPFALNFCLADYRVNDMKTSEKELDFFFRHLTDKQILTLKCVQSDGPPIYQYCEMYLDDKVNVLEKLKQFDPYNKSNRFRPQSKLELTKAPFDVKVSYVESAQEFYIHLQHPETLKLYDATCDDLLAMANAPVLRHQAVGSCCSVLLSGEFYRGLIVGKVLNTNRCKVKLIDFGIVEEIPENSIRLLTEKFFDIPPFAYKACLKGFESLDVNENISTQFDIFCGDGRGERKIFKMLIKEFDTAKETYQVELEDPSVTPPVNVNKMLLKNSRPLIETIQLENAKKRQKEGNVQKKPNELEPVQLNRNFERGRNNASQRGRGQRGGMPPRIITPTAVGSNHIDTMLNPRTNLAKDDTGGWRSKETTPSESIIDHLKNDDNQKAKKVVKCKEPEIKKKSEGDLETGWVSTLVSVNRAFVHFDHHIEGLEKILDEMFAFYENKSRPYLKELHVGADCATRSEDGNWYRSRIEAVSGEKIKVFHREYGNIENVTKSKVRRLDEKFAEIGELVVPTFFAIKPAPECDDKTLFNEMMKLFDEGVKEFNFKVVKSFNSGWLLEPIEQQTNKNVIDELVKKKKAQRISENELTQILETKATTKETIDVVKPREQPKKQRKSPEKIKKVELEVPKPPLKKTKEIVSPKENVSPKEISLPKENPQPKENSQLLDHIVKITAVTSPTDFYICKKDSMATFSKLHEDIQIIASSAQPLTSVEEGTLCLAKQPYDLCFYRAKIIDSDESDQMITVRCLDDGKTFSVDDKTFLRKMPAALENKKFFGIACALPVKVERKFDEDATNFIMKLMDNELSVNFLTKETVPAYVELLNGDENVSDLLVNKKYVRRLEIVEPGSGYTSHINSLQSFYLQFEIDQLKLDLIAQYFEEASGKFEKIVKPQPGEVVAALFPDDSNWYRATVVDSVETEGKFSVKFIDYGNVCLVESAGRIAEPAIKELPAMSKHCSLAAVLKDIKINEAAEQKFMEITASGATILEIKMVKPGDNVTEVDIFLNGKSIVEDLILACE